MPIRSEYWGKVIEEGPCLGTGGVQGWNYCRGLGTKSPEADEIKNVK